MTDANQTAIQEEQERQAVSAMSKTVVVAAEADIESHSIELKASLRRLREDHVRQRAAILQASTTDKKTLMHGASLREDPLGMDLTILLETEDGCGVTVPESITPTGSPEESTMAEEEVEKITVATGRTSEASGATVVPTGTSRATFVEIREESEKTHQ